MRITKPNPARRPLPLSSVATGEAVEIDGKLYIVTYDLITGDRHGEGYVMLCDLKTGAAILRAIGKRAARALPGCLR